MRTRPRYRTLGLLTAGLAMLLLTAPSWTGVRGDRLGAVGGPPLASPTPEASPILFGTYVGPRGSQNDAEAVLSFESGIGRTLAVHHVYHGWNGPLIGDLERWSAEQGRTLLINWKAALTLGSGSSAGEGAGYVRWRSITSGDRDQAIRRKARQLKEFGEIVYLAFHHEPEDDRDLEGLKRAGSARSFRNAFRHIHEVFEGEGVENVRFILVLMGFTFQQGEAETWYPGDDVVDVVAADAYNWFGTDHSGRDTWTTFTSAFQAAYDWATARGKPFWVAETGTLEDPDDPLRKARWYEEMAAQIKAWPNLRAFVYFAGARNGWWPDSSREALAAFQAVAQDPYFSGTS